jgi:hypothetical protein
MRLRFHPIFVLSCLFIAIDQSSLYAVDPIQNSCGIIKTYFEKGDPHGTNGFVIKKGEKVYFLTVLHVSKSFGQVNELKAVEIILPNLISHPLRKKPSQADFLEGDSIKTKRLYGNLMETVDVLAIDITTEFKELAGIEAMSRIISFEALAGFDKKEEIDKNFDQPLDIAGYPATGDGSFIQTSEYQTAKINQEWSKDGYGAITTIKEGEYPSGFWMDIKTNHGDCGRPVILRQNSNYMLIGLIKTGDDARPLTFAIDGTAIVRTLELEKS